MKKKSKTRNYKNYILPVIITLIMLGVIGVFATTYITNNQVQSTTGSFTNITANNLNDIGFVSSIAQLQEVINNYPIIHVQKGDYPISTTINISSNKTIFIDEGALIYWNTTNNPLTLLDIMNMSNYSFMFYSANSNNIKIINKGKIYPRKITSTSYTDIIFGFFNSSNLDIEGGKVSSTGHYIFLINVSDSQIYNIKADSITQVVVAIEGGVNNFIHDIFNWNSKGETIDLNYNNVNTTIKNIDMFCYSSSSDQVVDINTGNNIYLSSIYGNNCKQSLAVNEVNNGRFFDSSVNTSSGIQLFGSMCYNCSSEPLLTGKKISAFYETNYMSDTVPDAMVYATNGYPAILWLEPRSNNNSAIYLGTQGDLDWAISSVATSSDVFVINSEDGPETTRFTIEQTGNIGIGTTAPQEKLDIEGNLSFSLDTYTNRYIKLHNLSSYIYSTPKSSTGATMNFVTGYGGSGNSTGFFFDIDDSSVSPGKFVIRSSNDVIFNITTTTDGDVSSLIFSDDNSAKLTIDNSGNVILGRGNLTIPSNGVLKLTANTTSTICSSITEGNVYYDDSTHKLYACNSTCWYEPGKDVCK